MKQEKKRVYTSPGTEIVDLAYEGCFCTSSGNIYDFGGNIIVAEDDE